MSCDLARVNFKQAVEHMFSLIQVERDRSHAIWREVIAQNRFLKIADCGILKMNNRRPQIARTTFLTMATELKTRLE